MVKPREEQRADRAERRAARATTETTNFGKSYDKGGTTAEAPPRVVAESFHLDDIHYGPAAVEFGHEKKSWGQHAQLDTGLSLGASCKVTIFCEQDEESVVKAQEIAKRMSKEFAWRAHEEVKQELVEFLEDPRRR